MAYNLIITPLAEQDIAESYQWYNEQQDGLGNDFLNELERSLDLIKTNPHQYQVRYKQIRMTKVRRFPICLHYLVREEEIFVQAILSTSRNPRIWRKKK
jgi:toxin ParE1/3/4